MGGFAVYDSEAVDLVMCAVPINDGRADEFVKVSQDEDAFGTEVSADGKVTRFATHSPLYTVEVTLKRSSTCNPILAALFAVDRNSTDGSGVGVFYLRDNNGSTILAGDKCWIKKLPDWQFGKAVGDVTWVFGVVASPTAMIPGGN